MSIVSTGNLALLRADGHKTQVWGSPLIPVVLWSARINDSGIIRGDTAIVFDGGSGSNFSLVEAPQEVWVGTEPGIKDVGRLRIRSISSGDSGATGTLTAAYHSIILGDDQYLTFKFDYPFRQKWPFMESDGTFKKDRDIAYSDQNTEPNPVCVCGTDRAKFILDATPDSVTFNVDVSESYAIADGASISSYSCAALPSTGAGVSFNTSTGLGTINFTQTGQWWIRFGATDSNGKTQYSYRCYFVHDPDPNGADHPLIDFSTLRLSGDWQRGGWTSAFSADDNASLDQIPDETRFVIWSDNWYGLGSGKSKKNITFLPDSSEVILAGYVIRDETAQDLDKGHGSVTFEIATANEMLRRYNFSVGLEVVQGTPSAWHQYEDWLTIGRAIHHLWWQHSTAFEAVDIIGLMDDTTARAYTEFEDADLYTMADGFSFKRGTRQHLVCDKGGRIHLTHDLQLLRDSDRAALDNAFEITLEDVSGLVTIERAQINKAAFVKVSGFSWDGSFTVDDRGYTVPDALPACASSPGLMPDDEGATIYMLDRQTWIDQTHCNEISGRVFAQQNNLLPLVPLTFHGNYLGVLDVAYNYMYSMSLQAGDTARGMIWTDQGLILRTVTASYDIVGGTYKVYAEFEGEQDGVVGVPAWCLDSFPDYGGETDPPDVDTAPDALVTGGGGSSIYFKSGMGKDWALRSADAISALMQDPYWVTKQGSYASNDAILIAGGDGILDRSTDAFQTAGTDVLPGTDPPNTAGDSPAPTASDLNYTFLEGSYVAQNEHHALANWQNGAGEWRTWLYYTADNFSTGSWKYLGSTAGCAEYGTKSSAFSAGAFDVDWGYWHLGNVIVEVAASKYVIFYEDSSESNTYVRAFSMAGDTITLGAALDIGEYSDGGHICYVDTDKFAIAMSATVTNTAVKIGTVAGVTITLGSANNILTAYETAILSGIFEKGLGMSVCCPTSSSIIITRFGKICEGTSCLDSSDYGWWSMWGTITGTGITWSQITDCGTGNETVGQWRTIARSLVINHWDDSHAVRVGSKGLVGITGGSMNDRLDMWSVLSSEDSASSVVTVASDVSTKGDWCMQTLSDTKALVIWQAWPVPNTLYYVYGSVVDLSSATPSAGSPQLLWTSPSASEWGDSLYCAVLSSGRAAVSFTKYGDDCQTIIMLNISGNTITTDESCASMNIYTGPIHSQSTTKLMLVGWDEPNSWDGVIWTGITGEDIDDCAPSDCRGLGMSLSKWGTSERAWITIVNGVSGALELLDVTIPSMAINDRFSLGSATMAQVDSKEFTAIPFADFQDDLSVYVAGRMDDPQSLGPNCYLIFSIDAGTNWFKTPVDGTWLDGYAGSIWVEPGDVIFVMRNTAAGGAKLYFGTSTKIELMSTLPLAAGVNPDAMKIDARDLAVYACSNTGVGIMVVKALPPYSSWIDMTYDHGTSSGVRSIELL